MTEKETQSKCVDSIRHSEYYGMQPKPHPHKDSGYTDVARCG